MKLDRLQVAFLLVLAVLVGVTVVKRLGRTWEPHSDRAIDGPSNARYLGGLEQ